MKTTIENIASIQTGVYAKPAPVAAVFYIQARHVDSDGQLLPNLQPELDSDEKLKKHLLQPGDVLVAAKGNEHFAACYTGTPGPAVASSVFIVLRINNGSILPGFLAWYINHPETQKILSACARGTSLPAITKRSIGELKINIPEIRRQELILAVDKLGRQRRKLATRIEELKQKTLQQYLFGNL